MSDPPTEDFKHGEMSEIIDDIRYWSYCTWKGMEATCPEKKEELRAWLAGFAISPWVSEVGVTPRARQEGE